MYQSAKGYGQGESSLGAGMVGQNYMGREGASDTENEDWDNAEPQSPVDDFTRCEEKPEFVFESGARYNGQWLNNMRHGFGVQVWPDGARYEGFWKNNKAHGKGTFWHVYGDRYEGEWKRDKAHGVGKYTHSNGATYEG